MNPKHKNPDRSNRLARAPYNFISLPETVVQAERIPEHDRYHADRNTGYIDCDLTTESPLYTRAMVRPEFFRKWADDYRLALNDKQAREEYASFYNLGDANRPVIPGSSLRGMVRALLEIIGYGKMQWVNDELLVFRAVGDRSSLGELYRNRLKPSTIKAGYLYHQGEHWEIRPAKFIAGSAFARIRLSDIPREGLERWQACRNAFKIFVRIAEPRKEGNFPLVSRASSTPFHESQAAVLVKTGWMRTKKKEFVFGLPDKEAQPVRVPEEVVRSYRNQVTPGQEALLGEKGALRTGQPVFYLVEGESVTYFGHAMMFRLPYPNTPLDLVPKHLHEEAHLDLAEAIFGYAKSNALPEGKERTCAGRVFFTDAEFVAAPDGIWLSNGPITPKILSSPKPTTFQHYLTQPEPNQIDTLKHYGSSPTPTIRGHKFYWHKGPVGLEQIEESITVDWSEDKQHTCIKPVKPGVSFRFRLFFENLSDVELGALIWVLTLPGERGRTYRHKIGMGKPLGMGAIHIKPALYLSDRSKRYSRLLEGNAFYEAYAKEKDMQRFVKIFEQHVLAGMHPAERGQAQSVKDLERIKMLLRMLEWPGPDPTLTRYMQIIGPNGNEYRGRPVLPDPLHISPSSKV